MALLRPIGLRDPRPLVLAALLALGAALYVASAGSRAPVALGVLLVPPLALGSVLGSPVALPAAALVGAFLTTNAAAAGFLAGVAAAFDHRAALAAPFVILAVRPAWRRAAAGLLVGYFLLVLPAAWPDPGAWLRRTLAWPTPEPGVGLGNLFYYWGGAPSAPGLVFLACLATAVLVLLVWRGVMNARVGAAIGALAAVFLAAAPTPEELGLPIALLALAGLANGEEVGDARTG